MVRAAVRSMKCRHRKREALPLKPKAGHARIINAAEMPTSLLAVGVGRSIVVVRHRSRHAAIKMLKQGVKVRAGRVFLLCPTGPYVNRLHRAKPSVAIASQNHGVTSPVSADEAAGIKPPLVEHAGFGRAMRRVDPQEKQPKMGMGKSNEESAGVGADHRKPLLPEVDRPFRSIRSEKPVGTREPPLRAPVPFISPARIAKVATNLGKSRLGSGLLQADRLDVMCRQLSR